MVSDVLESLIDEHLSVVEVETDNVRSLETAAAGVADEDAVRRAELHLLVSEIGIQGLAEFVKGSEPLEKALPDGGTLPPARRL